jgi:hypothetical protein
MLTTHRAMQPHNASACVLAACPMLITLIGSLRGGERTWRTLLQNVLRPNNAHLALLVAPGTRRTVLHRHASHIWHSQEFDDWSLAIDGVAAEIGVPNRTAWRRGVRPSNRVCCHHDLSCCMRPSFLGPIRWSAAINLVMRWQLKQRLLADGLLDMYERFVITRSDQFYGCTLPLLGLDPTYVWLPQGEDYGGVTDRFVLCSRSDLVRCLTILDGFVRSPEAYEPDLNPERYFKRRLVEQALWPRVHRFPRVMFTAARRSDKSRWSPISALRDPTYGVHFKYERAYIRTLWNCGECTAAAAEWSTGWWAPAPPFCCSHLNHAWARALADRITGKHTMGTSTWDQHGHCRVLGWWWLAAAAAAAVLLLLCSPWRVCRLIPKKAG